MTHSGKSTFAQNLANHIPNLIVIDPDNHAEFINKHYRSLLPTAGANTLKNGITEFILNYASNQSDRHIIFCGANRYQVHRRKLLDSMQQKGFKTVIVHFAIPIEILKARVQNSTRKTTIFRSASGFEEVLTRQISEVAAGAIIPPEPKEAVFFFEVNQSDQSNSVIRSIAKLIQ